MTAGKSLLNRGSGMRFTEKQILNIIQEEVKDVMKERLLLERSKWRIPGDNTYEYSLTSNGNAYIAYQNGKALGTYSDAAGLKKVKDNAPIGGQSLADWFKQTFLPSIGDSEKADPWAREYDKGGPIHALQDMLGVTADGAFGPRSRAAWAQQTDNSELPSNPQAAIKQLPKVEPKKSEYGIEYFTTLKGKLKSIDEEKLVRGLEARGVVACKVDACAQFVSDNLSAVYTRLIGFQGNAWLAHLWYKPNLISTFQENAAETAPKAAKVFSGLNSRGGDGMNSSVSNLVRSVLPDQKVFGNIKLGTVVGLYYPSSTYHSRAFFEAATRGEFFQTEDGEPWSEEMLKKNIAFVPAEEYANGKKSFGMNTHLGFVGATYEGEPIIFHNVHGDVRATPLRAMAPSRLMIVWSRPGGGGGRLGQLGAQARKYLGLGESNLDNP